MRTVPDPVESYLELTHGRRLDAFIDFLRIPSVSAIPDHAEDCRAAAEWLAADLARAGLEHAEVSVSGGNPVVYGDWLHAAGAPTVLVYGHYDVQPVDPIDSWATPPFAPVVHEGRILGRGTADSKGHVQMHVRAVEAILATRGRLPVNLRLLFEGEEEVGSPHLDGWLVQHGERMRADAAVISDTNFFDGNLPAIPVALRGLVHVQIDVFGPSGDLHSGNFGGTVQNPGNALAAIIAALKDASGRIQIPGFYDAVRPVSGSERATIDELPFSEEAYRAAVDVPALAGEAGYSTLERRGARPTLDVNGMWAGYAGRGPKAIIPAEAHAKVSCRLVPDQDPELVFRLLREYILAVAPPGVRVEVESLGCSQPVRTAIDHPVTKAAAHALESTFGQRPLFIREGGSIAPAASFARILGLPVLLLGFAPPDDRSHAPNEWMDLHNFETGIRTLVRLWDEVGSSGR